MNFVTYCSTCLAKRCPATLPTLFCYHFSQPLLLLLLNIHQLSLVHCWLFACADNFCHFSLSGTVCSTIYSPELIDLTLTSAFGAQWLLVIRDDAFSRWWTLWRSCDDPQWHDSTIKHSTSVWNKWDSKIGHRKIVLPSAVIRRTSVWLVYSVFVMTYSFLDTIQPRCHAEPYLDNVLPCVTVMWSYN